MAWNTRYVYTAYEVLTAANLNNNAANLDYLKTNLETQVGIVDKMETDATVTGTKSLDLSSYMAFLFTLTGSVTLSFTNTPTDGLTGFTLQLKQDATGGRTVTWPSSVDWPKGAAPSLTAAANAVDILSFASFDGGTIWNGFLSGDNLS